MTGITYALLLLITPADTGARQEAYVLDYGMTQEDCAVRLQGQVTHIMMSSAMIDLVCEEESD